MVSAMLGLVRTLLLSLILGVAIPAALPSGVEAQEAENVESNVQGTVGLGLIGAELGFVVPAAFGAKGWWPYVVFPVVGAAGGAIAGYFAIDNNGERDVGVAMLTTGVALALPALVLTVWLTAYDPDDEDIPSASSLDENEEDNEEADVEAEEKENASASVLPGGLVQFRQSKFRMGIPLMGVAPIRKRDGGLDARFEVSLLSGSF